MCCNSSHEINLTIPKTVDCGHREEIDCRDPASMIPLNAAGTHGPDMYPSITGNPRSQCLAKNTRAALRHSSGYSFHISCVALDTIIRSLWGSNLSSWLSITP